MKNKITLKAAVLGMALLVTFSASAQKKKKDERMKALDGKKYTVQFYEVKAAGRGKAVPSDITLKGGEILCNFTEDKISCPPATFQIITDSTYTEDDTEMKLYKIEALVSVEKDSYKWEATIINYDIEGPIVQSKSGVHKKPSECAGTEKAKQK
ncbi:MAG: hypothetical protein ACT4ON_13735 [Bacteroidota bacterium]